MIDIARLRDPPRSDHLPLRCLAVSGSLRLASLNTALLRATQMLAGSGFVIDLYEELGDLPHFNPDLDVDCARLPAPVARLRRKVAAADALIIACPEYARGLPGCFKNALDWLVGSPDFPGARVALFNASARASHAQAALRLTLQTMSADLVEGASIVVPVPGGTTTPLEIAADPAFAFSILDALDILAQAKQTSTLKLG